VVGLELGRRRHRSLVTRLLLVEAVSDDGSPSRVTAVAGGAGSRRAVVAVDAGGTSTRVGCFALDGRLLAAATGGGGSPHHDDDARTNVDAAVVAALDAAGVRPSDTVALAAGVAGFQRAGSNQGSADNAWAADFFSVPGLSCPRVLVNDAVVAHRGALAGAAGIIAVAGTGSMILAIDEGGDEVESGQFEHYAGGARHLVYDVVQRVLVGPTDASADPITGAVLAHWEASDVDELRWRILQMQDTSRNDVKRRYGALAPMVTAAADTSPIADAALWALVTKTARGIELLAPLVSASRVPVALAGALATSPAFRSRLATQLAARSHSTFLTEAELDPLRGAAILALEAAQVSLTPEVLSRLRAEARE
jgi:glucosamine kinase